MKIYCKFCKFIIDIEPFYEVFYNDWRCKTVAMQNETFYGKEIEYGYSSVLNKNNDCKNFKPVWWYALWLWILRRKL